MTVDIDDRHGCFTQNLAGTLDKELAVCHSLRSETTSLDSADSKVSSNYIRKDCVGLLHHLKTDIRVLHLEHCECNNSYAYQQTSQLEGVLQQINVSADPAITLSRLVRLMQMKESLTIRTLSQILSTVSGKKL